MAKALKQCPYCGWQGVADGTKCPRCSSLLVVVKLRPKPLKRLRRRPKLRKKGKVAKKRSR